MTPAAATSKAIAQQSTQNTAVPNAQQHVQQAGSNSAAASASSANAASSAAENSKFEKTTAVFTEQEARKLPKAWSISRGDLAQLFETSDPKSEDPVPEARIFFDKKWTVDNKTSFMAATTAATATSTITTNPTTANLKIEQDSNKGCQDSKEHSEKIDKNPKMFLGAAVSRVVMIRTEHNPHQKLESAVYLVIFFEVPRPDPSGFYLNSFFKNLYHELQDAVPGFRYYDREIGFRANEMASKVNCGDLKNSTSVQFCIGSMDRNMIHDIFECLSMIFTEEESHYFKGIINQHTPKMEDELAEAQVRSLVEGGKVEDAIDLIRTKSANHADSSAAESLDDAEAPKKAAEELEANHSNALIADTKRITFDLGMILQHQYPKQAIDVFEMIKPHSIFYTHAQMNLAKIFLGLSQNNSLNIEDRVIFRKKAITDLLNCMDGVSAPAKVDLVYRSYFTALEQQAGIEPVVSQMPNWTPLTNMAFTNSAEKLYSTAAEVHSTLLMTMANQLRMYRDPSYKSFIKKEHLTSPISSFGNPIKPVTQGLMSDSNAAMVDSKHSAETVDSAKSAAITASSAASAASDPIKSKALAATQTTRFLRTVQEDFVLPQDFEVISGDFKKLFDNNYQGVVVLKRKNEAGKPVNMDAKDKKETDEQKNVKENQAVCSHIAFKRESIPGMDETLMTLSFVKPLDVNAQQNVPLAKEPRAVLEELKNKIGDKLFGGYLDTGFSNCSFEYCPESSFKNGQFEFSLTYRVTAMHKSVAERFFNILVEEGIFSRVQAATFSKYCGHRLPSIEEQGLMQNLTKALAAAKTSKTAIDCDKVVELARKVRDTAAVEGLSYAYSFLPGDKPVVHEKTPVPIEIETLILNLDKEGLRFISKKHAMQVLELIKFHSPFHRTAQDEMASVALDLSWDLNGPADKEKVEVEHFELRKRAVKSQILNILISGYTKDKTDWNLLYRLLEMQAGYDWLSKDALFSDFNQNLHYKGRMYPSIFFLSGLPLHIANRIWDMNPSNPKFSVANAFTNTAVAASTAATASAVVQNPSAQSPAAMMLTAFNNNAASAPMLSSAVVSSTSSSGPATAAAALSSATATSTGSMTITPVAKVL